MSSQSVYPDQHSHVSGNPALHCTHNKRIFPLILTTPTKQLLNFHSTVFMKPETIKSYRHSAVQCPQHLEFVNIFFNESQITLLVPASHWSQSIHELFSHSRELGSIFGVVSLFIILVSVWHHILWMEVGEDWWGLVRTGGCSMWCWAECQTWTGDTGEAPPVSGAPHLTLPWPHWLTQHCQCILWSPALSSTLGLTVLAPLLTSPWPCSPSDHNSSYSSDHSFTLLQQQTNNTDHWSRARQHDCCGKTSRWYKTDIRYLAVETIKKDWAESI